MNVIDQHAARLRIHFVAHGAFDGIEILKDRGWHLGALALGHDGPPRFGEAFRIFAEILHRCANARAAHDVSGAGNELALVFGDHLLAHRDQARAFAFVFDAARQRDARLVGHHHQQTPRDGDIRGKPRALFADGVLHHLHDDLFALAHAIGDFRGTLVIVEAGQIREAAGFARAQKSGAIQADIDECGLHAGQNALHAPENDVADEAMAAAAALFLQRAVIEADRAFEEKLLELSFLDNSDTNFPRPAIDQDFLVHLQQSK